MENTAEPTQEETVGGKLSAETSPPPTTQYKENLVGIPTVISISLLIAIITSAVSIYSYDHWYAQKMVAVDIRGYITQQKADFVAGKLTEDQLKGKFDELERVVVSIPKNKIVLMGDAVVRNAEVVKIP